MGYSCPYCGFYINDFLCIEIEDGSYRRVTCSYCRAILDIDVSIEVVKDGEPSKKAEEGR